MTARTIKVAITITQDEFIVDLRGNPEQSKSAFNTSYEATVVDAKMIFKAVTSPRSFANAGTFKPLRVLVDEGSMFAAQYPSAMSVYYEVGIMLFDLLWKALAPALGDSLPAGHYASICGTFIGGPHPDTGKPHSIVEPQLGGLGRLPGQRRHQRPVHTGHHGDTFNCPVEITEQRNGLQVDRFCLNEEPGGEGEFIGGKGINLDYRIPAR